MHAGNACVLLLKLVLWWLAEVATSAREFKLWEKFLLVELVDRRHKVKDWLQKLVPAYAVAVTTALFSFISRSFTLLSGHEFAAQGRAARVSAVSLVRLRYLLSLLLSGMAWGTFRALWLDQLSLRAHHFLYNTLILLGWLSLALFGLVIVFMTSW